jgi:integrase
MPDVKELLCRNVRHCSQNKCKKKTKGGYKTTTRPRSAAVVNRELCLLSAIFRVAIKKKQASKNPCHEAELVKGEKPRKRFLYSEEEERLMSVLVGTLAHLKDLVRLAIYTGLRQGELLKLAVDDVDLIKKGTGVVGDQKRSRARSTTQSKQPERSF